MRHSSWPVVTARRGHQLSVISTSMLNETSHETLRDAWARAALDHCLTGSRPGSAQHSTFADDVRTATTVQPAVSGVPAPDRGSQTRVVAAACCTVVVSAHSSASADVLHSRGGVPSHVAPRRDTPDLARSLRVEGAAAEDLPDTASHGLVTGDSDASRRPCRQCRSQRNCLMRSIEPGHANVREHQLVTLSALFFSDT